MNCQEVDVMIPDLARGAVVGEGALAHVKSCRRCSERLAEEENLTAGLFGLAEASSGEQTPARVEVKLLEAFRRQSAPAEVTRARRRWLPFAVAAAALLAFQLFTSMKQEPQVVRVLDVPRQLAAPVETARSGAPPGPVKIRTASRRVKRPARDTKAAEMAVDFLPVQQGDGWTPRDGGRLVRVGLPRSALRVFGLPVIEERAQEQVQADVVLSNDGLLRAIRFVP